MSVFVHLTSERNLAAIRRSGISPRRPRHCVQGVFAMPVTRNFYVSHQWVRELKRLGGGSILGVYFRLRDDEPVMVGRFNRPHDEMTAAVALVMGAETLNRSGTGKLDAESRQKRREKNLPESSEGFEVIVPRRIKASEVIRFKSLPQVVGRRYFPGANGDRPQLHFCCGDKGTYGVLKLLRKVEETEAADKPTKITVFGREEDSFRRVEQLRRRRQAESKRSGRA
jgi:hypothetical protein